MLGLPLRPKTDMNTTSRMVLAVGAGLAFFFTLRSNLSLPVFADAVEDAGEAAADTTGEAIDNANGE